MGSQSVLAVLANHQRALWAAAVLFYGLGDTVTTFWGLSVGTVSEGGVVAGPLIEVHGQYALLAVKAAVFAGFYAAWRLRRGPGRTAVPAALATVGATVSIWNLYVVYTS
jgi:hypothetical protein